MLFLMIFLHAGPWNHAGGTGDGGWGPPFGFFPFFPFFPALFWMGLIVFVVTRINRGRGRHHAGGMMSPSAPVAGGPTPTGPSWPDLDPTDPAPTPAPAPKRADDSDTNKVEYV